MHHVNGVRLENGVHTYTDMTILETVLSGPALAIARLNVRLNGSVRVCVNTDYVPLAIEPYPFEEDREPERSASIPRWLSSKVVRASKTAATAAPNRYRRVLTMDDRAAIKASNESGATLALRYGVTRQAISSVRTYTPRVRAKTYKRKHDPS